MIPVYDITEDTGRYPLVCMLTMGILVCVYSGFGVFNYMIYGDGLEKISLITKILPQGSIFVSLTELIYMVNLIITYPLVIHPTN